MKIGRLQHCRMVAMRDGVRLATTLFLTEAPGRYPAILFRTPYGRAGDSDGWNEWVREGYVLIVQDCRGRFDSEGTFEPFLQEARDTPDTVA